jgi:hypothetical protein
LGRHNSRLQRTPPVAGPLISSVSLLEDHRQKGLRAVTRHGGARALIGPRHPLLIGPVGAVRKPPW